jgi:hypothetical protein
MRAVWISGRVAESPERRLLTFEWWWGGRSRYAANLTAPGNMVKRKESGANSYKYFLGCFLMSVMSESSCARTILSWLAIAVSVRIFARLELDPDIIR